MIFPSRQKADKETQGRAHVPNKLACTCLRQPVVDSTERRNPPVVEIDLYFVQL